MLCVGSSAVEVRARGLCGHAMCECVSVLGLFMSVVVFAPSSFGAGPACGSFVPLKR